MSDYRELEQFLHGKGIGSYFQNPDQFVISNANPAMPNSNSFWVTKKNGEWYLGTWLPAIYHVPAGANIGNVVEIVFRSSPTSMYTIGNETVGNLKLRRLSEEEISRLGLA
jgi:hypothetical protein